MRLSLVTAPTVEPLSTATAKLHLRVDHGNDDTFIDLLIKAARRHAEAITGRQLINATWDLGMDRFPAGAIDVPLPPLSSVTSISYTDSAGDSQTWSSSLYQVDAPAGPYANRGRILPAYGEVYPTTRTSTVNAVTVRFVAGYGTAGTSVPDAILHAMLLMVGEWYLAREDAQAPGLVRIPNGAMALLSPYVSRPVMA